MDNSDEELISSAVGRKRAVEHNDMEDEDDTSSLSSQSAEVDTHDAEHAGPPAVQDADGCKG